MPVFLDFLLKGTTLICLRESKESIMVQEVLSGVKCYQQREPPIQ